MMPANKTKNTYSVGQINSYIKNMFAQDYMLRSVYVRGEVSNVKYHSSGHIYFTMKDKAGTLACVMFAGNRGGLRFNLREGQQIITFGSIDVYERDGKYQMYAREIVPDGEGRLYERFEQLKRELEEMGMFDARYKKPIPAYINTLGVVTAPTGAAIRDIINITKRRNPHVNIILYPAKVQGDGAVQSIVSGINALQTAGVDVMIVGRGGGSIEDLWAFNEEAVARAIFDSEVPVISAVGHETDTTIADYAADLRAPTPSAGAELAVYDYEAVVNAFETLKDELKGALLDNIEKKRNRYEKQKLKLINLSPSHRLREQRVRLIRSEERIRELIRTGLDRTEDQLDLRTEKLKNLMHTVLAEKRHLLDIKIEKMDALSPLKRLSSGYVFAETPDGSPLTSIERINRGDEIRLSLKDGRAGAVITEIEKK